jgi:lipopolysaccharide exporter
MPKTPEPASGKGSGLGRPSRGEPPSLSARVRRGALWSALSTLVLRLVTIAVTAVVAHILAPRDFGVFTVALTVYLIVSSLGELGIASCLVRADLDIDAMAPTMVTVSLTMSALFAGAMAVSAPHIAAALGSADATEPVRVMALVVLINGFFAVPGAQLTREFKQDKLFLANAISLIPSTTVLLLLAKSGDGAMAFAWSRVASQLVMGCVMFASIPKHYGPGYARGPLSVLFRFGLPLAGANFVNFILLNVDYAFVGHLMGAVALGIYMLAFTLASAPGLLLGTVINSIAMPAFSRVKHDLDLLRNAMAGALRAVSLILMPMCGLTMALARPLVLTLYGARWSAAAEVLSILSLYGAVSIICILFANMLTSLGKAKFTLFVQLLWLGALVPAMALGVHRNGIVGAALAHIAVIGPLVLPSYLVALRRATGIRFTTLGKAVLPPLLAASAAAVAARVTASQFASPLLQLVTGLAVGGLIYLVAVAPLSLALLSQEQAAKLRRLPLFRFYDSVARLTRLPVSSAPHPAAGSEPYGHGKGGRYVPRHGVGGVRHRPRTATLTPSPASEDLGAAGGHRVAVAGRITGLLRPEAQVVPFWPRSELDELLAWCKAPGQVAVRLVTGEGGTGKTRLAMELTRVLGAEGWQALWVPPGKEAETVGAARRTARPAVLVVDYVETRAGIPELLAEAADGGGELIGPDLRVVLLARSAGEWWHKLINQTGYRLGEMLLAERAIRLGPVSQGTVRAVFDAAVTEFAGTLSVSRPAARLTLSDPDAAILVVHAAALSAVLDHVELTAGAGPRSSAEVLDSLLRREIRYCAQAAAARGLDLDPSVQRRAVAAGCLIGADSEAAAVGLLRRLPDFVESAERRGQVARWLRDLYPGHAPDDRGGSEWLGSLCPDRAAEQLIVGELTQQPDLIPALFTGLDEARAKRALTVLGRAALRYPDAVPLLARALAADLENLAIPALAVAVETNALVDRLIADAIAAQAIPASALERIAAAIPRGSVALDETAIAVLHRLAYEFTDASGERVRRLNELSTRLADLGRQKEALAVIEEAAAVWRELARAVPSRPDAHGPSLAASQNDQPLRKRGQGSFRVEPE